MRARPLADADFRQLRPFMRCWRAPDLEQAGLEGLDEGWRVTGEGLEQASLLGYQIFVDGVEVPSTRGGFRAALVQNIENHVPRQPEQLETRETPGPKDMMPPELAPILVRFLRPEVAIMGADLREYGPFRKGEVVAIPFVHAAVYLQNDAATIYGGES